MFTQPQLVGFVHNHSAAIGAPCFDVFLVECTEKKEDNGNNVGTRNDFWAQDSWSLVTMGHGFVICFLEEILPCIENDVHV